MPFVNAKCTNCGGNLTVDDSKDAAICQYCGSAFVVEKAIVNYNNSYVINNATFNVSGVNIENLVARARQFESVGDIDKAIEYYNRVLDIDINHAEARAAYDRLVNAKRYIVGSRELTREQVLEAKRLIKSGQKIAAIKQIRMSTGCDLKDAKRFVDNLDLNDTF